MAVETLMIRGKSQAIELFVEEPKLNNATKVLVVCHPHPLFDGSATNKVTHTLARGGRDAGMVSIRFNFRGVGNIEGHFDHGVGELDDLHRVIDWSVARYKALELHLAGFSFGAFVALRGMMGRLKRLPPCCSLVLVSPPVENFSLPNASKNVPLLLMQGDEDEIVSYDSVYAWYQRQVNEQSAQINWRPFVGSGHFFHRRLSEMKREQLEFYNNLKVEKY